MRNNKLILKSQQRFRAKIQNQHNVFTEDVNKIALNNSIEI